jgi:hypothetical protein
LPRTGTQPARVITLVRVSCGRAKAVEYERFCRSPPPNRQKIAKNDLGRIDFTTSLCG